MIAKYYQLLKEFVGFQSISQCKEYSTEIKKTAKRLKKIFDEYKFETKIIEGYGNPIIIAEFKQNKDLPICSIYGNYDIEIANKKDGRKEDPFLLYIGKDKIFARGVADSKGQILMHMISIFELIKEKRLGFNIRFIIEGEKLLGSQGLIKFIEENKIGLKSDFFLISEGSLINDNPCINTSTRGKIKLSLNFKTANNQLHPGLYGGIIPNSIHELSKLLSKLYGTNQQSNIPYFYYNVEENPININIKNQKIEFNSDKFQKENGLKIILKEKKCDIISQIGNRPTVQVISIKGGYDGNFSRNTIPNKANAILDFRIVKKQDPDIISRSFDQRIKSNIPEYIDYNIEIIENYSWTSLDINNKYVLKAEKILEDIFKKDLINIGSGTSLGILNTLSENISDKILIIPFSNYDSSSHGTNENLDISLIEKSFLFGLNFFGTQLLLF